MRNRRRYANLGERIGHYRAVARSLIVRWQRPARVILCSVALAVATALVWHALTTTDHFVLKKTTVVGNRWLTSDEVVAACGLRTGMTNLFFSSAAEIGSTCESDQRIRSAHVEIVLPDKVTISVEEHEPVMYCATGHGLYAVNAFGEVYAPADMNDLRDLPLLVLKQPMDAASLMDVMKDALSLVRTISRPHGPWADQGLIIEYDQYLGFSVAAPGHGLKARFGEPPFQKKYERLLAALDVAAERRLVIEEAFLDNTVRPNAVTLRLSFTGAIATVHDGYGP